MGFGRVGKFSSCLCGSVSVKEALAVAEAKKETETKTKAQGEKLPRSDAFEEGLDEEERMTLEKDFLFQDSAGVFYLKNHIFLKHIERGSTSTVKLALNLDTASLEAVKVVSSKHFAKQWRSVKHYKNFVKSLKHPNIIAFRDVIEDKKGKTIVSCMEYVDGGCIMPSEKFTEFPKPLSLQKTRNYFNQLLMGLLHLHMHDIIHGDLSLQNILCSGELVKICDMDSAIPLGQAKKLGLRTTPAYCAPELLGDRPQYSFKSDMWALGVCLYGLCHGYLPFNALGSKMALYKQIQYQELKMDKFLPAALQDLLRGLLTKNSKERFNSEDVVKNVWIRRELLRNVVVDSFKTDPLGLDLTHPNKFAECRYFKRGEHVLTKGERGNTVFFILSGDVAVLGRNDPQNEAHDDFPDENDYFGLSDMGMEDEFMDLEFFEGTDSMTGRAQKVAKGFINKVQQYPKVIRKKGGIVGEICAVMSLQSKDARRTSTCVALTDVKAMEIPIKALGTQCIRFLQKLAEERLEITKVTYSSEMLKKFYMHHYT